MMNYLVVFFDPPNLTWKQKDIFKLDLKLFYNYKNIRIINTENFSSPTKKGSHLILYLFISPLITS